MRLLVWAGRLAGDERGACTPGRLLGGEVHRRAPFVWPPPIGYTALCAKLGSTAQYYIVPCRHLVLYGRFPFVAPPKKAFFDFENSYFLIRKSSGGVGEGPILCSFSTGIFLEGPRRPYRAGHLPGRSGAQGRRAGQTTWGGVAHRAGTTGSPLGGGGTQGRHTRQTTWREWHTGREHQPATQIGWASA